MEKAEVGDVEKAEELERGENRKKGKAEAVVEEEVRGRTITHISMIATEILPNVDEVEREAVVVEEAGAETATRLPLPPGGEPLGMETHNRISTGTRISV